VQKRASACIVHGRQAGLHVHTTAWFFSGDVSLRNGLHRSSVDDESKTDRDVCTRNRRLESYWTSVMFAFRDELPGAMHLCARAVHVYLMNTVTRYACRVSTLHSSYLTQLNAEAKSYSSTISVVNPVRVLVR